jgi:signal transduction histidine kinase/ligand-binding sensor domain-containing protein
VASLLGAALTVGALDAEKAITQYHQDFWSEEDGLPQASVQAITQTRNGYIWIGTRDGLARFDGSKFTVYRGSEHPGLLSDDIRTLREDNLGRLWIGTFNGGVSCLENGVFRHYSAEDGLSTSGVLEIFQDRYGNLWFGSWGGISRFNRGRFEIYREDQGVMGKNGWSFIDDPKTGTLWAATDQAIHTYLNSGFQVDTNFAQLRTMDIRKIHIDGKGALWIGTLNGLVAHENGQLRTYGTAQGLADNRIRTLAEDKEGNLWVGTWDGLSRIKNNQITSLPKSGERINGMVDALFVDRDNSLWVGMRGGGLARLRDARFSNLTVREGLRSNIPRCVLESADGAIWIGSDGGGIVRMEGGSTQHFTRTNGLPSDFVASLAEGEDGTILAGLGRPAALAVIRGSKVIKVLKDGLPFEYSIRALFVDQAGRIWAGGDGGLCRIEQGEVVNISGLPESPVRAIWQDRHGKICAGSSGGLCVVEEDQVREIFDESDGLSHSAIYSCLEESDGTVWLGTQQGLTRWRGGVFTALGRDQGGFQGTIYQVLEDDTGVIWMATSRGIMSAKKNELNEVLDRRKQRLEATTYSTTDGLKSTQCIGGSQRPGIKTRDGRLLFATLNAVAIGRPSDPDPHTQPPPVLIEAARADRKEWAPNAVKRFRAGTEDFEFSYAAIRFITPERVLFRYQLVGRDANWVPAGDRRTAYYNNLRPGKYVFQVSASSDGMAWSAPAQSAEFILDPRFYQTYWFYLLCGAAVLGAGLALHRARITKERERFAVILNERTRIARDLHDTMAQGFAGTAFQLEALRSELSDAPEKVKKHLDLALTMVRHSFSEAKRTVLNLRSALLQETDVVGAVAETGRQMLAQSGVHLDVKAIGKAKRFNPEMEGQILRICQEALANALKHSEATKIEVEFDFSRSRPELSIRDNGSGFELDKIRAQSGMHFGLSGMSERVKQIGATLEIRTAPKAGTEIKIRLN